MKELRIPYGERKIINQYNNSSDYDTIIIPPTVKIIEDSFNNCESIIKILFETEIDNSYGEDIDDKYSGCHQGVMKISNSFNKISISNITIPYTTKLIESSFSFCNFLKQIKFDVRSDSKKRHKGFGVELIEKSFDYAPIEELTIPLTTDSIFSSFKHCSSLNNLTFDYSRIGYSNIMCGIKNISVDSFFDSNLSKVNIPSTVKGIDRFSFQSSLTQLNFFKTEYQEGHMNYIGNNACIFEKDNEAACLFIFDDGSTNYKICYHPGQHQYYMWETLYNKNIVESPNFKDLFNVFDGGVMAAKNNIITFLIDGTKCCVFLPNTLSKKQSEELVNLIDLMNDRQNKNSELNFEMHIYYDNVIYDEVNNDAINLRSFIEFLNSFSICDNNDYKENCK